MATTKPGKGMSRKCPPGESMKSKPKAKAKVMPRRKQKPKMSGPEARKEMDRLMEKLLKSRRRRRPSGVKAHNL
jgi:hypothetical protein